MYHIIWICISIFVWLWHLNRNYALTSLTRRIKTVDGSPIEQFADVACGFWGNTFDVIAMDLGKCVLNVINSKKKMEFI